MGNTYVIETEAYSSWFLIDSGADALGSMEEVAYHVRDKIGRIDVVLSNLRLFTLYTPFYINGGLNWLTLSPRQLREFVSMRSHCITLGPAGVANVCKTVHARHYLPYAHWWGELGEDAASGLDTPGQEERAVLMTLGDELRRVDAPTTILPWHIGDGFVAAPNGQLRHAPIGAS